MNNKIILQTVFKPSTLFNNDTFITTNSFRNQFFAGNQSDMKERERERKGRINRLLIGLR